MTIGEVASEANALSAAVAAPSASIVSTMVRGLLITTPRSPTCGHRNAIDPERVSCVPMNSPSAKPTTGKKTSALRLRAEAAAPVPVICVRP